jgi:prophage tail gpP-like protein
MAFNPREVCEITVDGLVFRDWESVTVHLAELEPYNWYKFQSTEGMPLAKNWATLRIRPGMRCSVKLGGELAITGNVIKRQVAYTRQRARQSTS